MILWVDTETNGLEDDALLLEIACVLTTDDLEPTNSFTSLVLANPDCPIALIRRGCRPEVATMHDESGLWAALTTFGDCIPVTYDVETRIVTWLEGHGVTKGTIPMAGSSVHFDRRILRRNMPRLEAFCHYRCIDVSTIKELYARWAPAVFEGRPQGTKRHRAMDDVQASIEELRYYRRFMLSHQEHVAR